MRSSAWALIQYNQCPYRKRKFGHRPAQMEDHVRTREEDGHLSVKGRGLRRSQPCLQLDLRLPSSRIT
ncbi:unnamed protein product [Nyctereutes procyonoides]|uniref:(raccoon dog) hypothetical protein n=1 Tax=Nyctereutes procyonoides TaxID=34880 RepID=A0A811YP00_NYCPR|nr:unnamed protein product [Nyctereutes procyonoides]